MKFPEIKVHLLAKTVPDRATIAEWVGGMMEPGAEPHVLPPEEETTDAELTIAYAAKRCYKSFEPGLNPNVTKVRKDLTAFFDNILRSGHGSVLEHATWTFAFENVTRVFTGELNRHRAGTAISEASMRYVRYDDIPFWMPSSIRPYKDEMLEEFDSQFREWEGKKAGTRSVISVLLREIEEAYKRLVELWELDKPGTDFGTKKKITSMLRRIMPMGICTGGVWTFNCRALRHIISMRTDPAAEEEIAHVFSKVAAIMVDDEPRLFGDFRQQEDGSWVPKYRKV